MPRVAKELGPLAVSRLQEPGLHPVGGVAGLMLQVSPSGSRSWLLRTVVGAKRREIGLGAFPGVGVALAREKAQATRDDIKNGIDPVAQRVAARQALIEEQLEAKARDWTFKRCAEAYIRAKRPGWRSDKHSKQWKATLEKYANPVIGDLLVRNVHTDHIRQIVEPHWTTRTETINRVRNRVELVLDWAAVRKMRSGDNPAKWKGNLDKLFADRSKVAPIQSHRSIPPAKLYEFMQRLRTMDGTAARCLEFVALTACRSGEARLATWDEIDLDAKTWTLPGSRMKSGRPHRVPLSREAIKLLKALPRLEGSNLLFPGSRKGSPLSDMSLTAVMRRMEIDAVPHGMRASFSSWCASSTAYSFEVREMALSHSIGDQTVAAYQRSDLFEKRRQLMQAWSKCLDAPPATGKVVALRGAA